MSHPQNDDLHWLSSYFSALVEDAKEAWIPLETVAQFLARGASKAVDIIYQAVGPVGPPIRPGSGSLFIVDERRLTNWRQDGYDYIAVGSTGGHVYTNTLAAGRDAVVVAECAMASHPPGLQRRAIRLPRIVTGGSTGLEASGNGWIWLVHYLFDVEPPTWLPKTAWRHPSSDRFRSLTEAYDFLGPSSSSAAQRPENFTTVGPTNDVIDHSGSSPRYTMNVTDDEIEAQVRAAEAAIHAALFQNVPTSGDQHHDENTESDIHSDEFEDESESNDFSGTGGDSGEYTETEEYQSDAGSQRGGSETWQMTTPTPDHVEAVSSPPRETNDEQLAQTTQPRSGGLYRFAHHIPVSGVEADTPSERFSIPPLQFDSTVQSFDDSMVGSVRDMDGPGLARYDSPQSMLGGTPRHGKLHSDGRLSPSLRELAEMRMAEVMNRSERTDGVERIAVAPTAVNSNVVGELFEASKSEALPTLATASAPRHPSLLQPPTVPANPDPTDNTTPYWVVAVDPTSRRLYYHDVTSGKSTWIPPADLSAVLAPPPVASSQSFLSSSDQPPAPPLPTAAALADATTRPFPVEQNDKEVPVKLHRQRRDHRSDSVSRSASSRSSRSRRPRHRTEEKRRKERHRHTRRDSSVSTEGSRENRKSRRNKDRQKSKSRRHKSRRNHRSSSRRRKDDRQTRRKRHGSSEVDHGNEPVQATETPLSSFGEAVQGISEFIVGNDSTLFPGAEIMGADGSPMAPHSTTSSSFRRGMSPLSRPATQRSDVTHALPSSPQGGDELGPASYSTQWQAPWDSPSSPSVSYSHSNVGGLSTQEPGKSVGGRFLRSRAASPPPPVATSAQTSPQFETAIARRWRLMNERKIGDDETVATLPLQARLSPAYGDDQPVRVRQSPRSPQRPPSGQPLSSDIRIFLDTYLGSKFVARLKGNRVRKVWRLKKLQTLRAQIRDTQVALREVEEDDSQALFASSLATQLSVFMEDFRKIFVEGDEDRLGRELALARKAANRAATIRTTKRVTDDSLSKPSRRPGTRQTRVSSSEPKVDPSFVAGSVDDGQEGKSEPTVKPWAKPRQKKSIGPMAPVGLGKALPSSSCWRVVVEVCEARNLLPGARIAAGPGMVQSESQQIAGPEVIDGRDCFAEAYIAKPPTSKPAGRTTPDAAKNPAATPVGDDGGDLKAIGKKKMTNIDIATLEPVWNKKFVLALPPKAVLKAISTSRSSRLDANDISSLTEEEHFAAVSACDYTLIVDVLDADRFSKEVFLGHVVLPVHSLPLRDALTKWHPLTRRGPKDKVKGDIKLQYVLLPPDPAMAIEQYQSLISSPGSALKHGREEKQKDRISELAKAKSQPRLKKRESDNDASGSDDQDEEKPKFLRAMSRRQRIVTAPPKVDYSKIQAKTVSRTAKSSLSPVRRGGVGEQSKVSKVKIDVSSGFAVPLGHQTPLREPLFPETRIPVPTMKSEGHRRQVSAPTGPISDPTPKRAARSGIPPPPANRPHRHSDENTSDAHQPVNWQQVLRGGQAKPTKESLFRHRVASEDELEVHPSGAVEFRSDAHHDNAFWLSGATNSGASPLPSIADSLRFAEVERFVAQQRVDELRHGHSVDESPARPHVSSAPAVSVLGGVETYIPLHKARLHARSETRAARAQEEQLDRAAAVQSVTDQLNRLNAELEGMKRSNLQPKRAPPPVPSSTSAPQSLDADFMALQRVFEDMLAKDEPPSYEDFLKKTSFLARAPSPPRSALDAVESGLAGPHRPPPPPPPGRTSLVDPIQLVQPSRIPVFSPPHRPGRP